VADLSAYDTGEKSLKEALLSESRWLGRALLAIARRQGLVAGVEVESMVRDGDIQEQIQAVVEEKDVSVIMLGAPRGTTTNIFGDDAIEQLALELEERTSVPVEIVRP
jgi:RNase H-fold protein (predicted Holliday junction resolvase)